MNAHFKMTINPIWVWTLSTLVQVSNPRPTGRYNLSATDMLIVYCVSNHDVMIWVISQTISNNIPIILQISYVEDLLLLSKTCKQYIIISVIAFIIIPVFLKVSPFWW